MQRHSRLLAEHLARRGDVRLTVIHPHAVPIFDPVLGIQEVQVPAIDTSRFYLGELWRYSGHVAEALDGLKPDVIMAQGFSVWKGIGRFSERLIVHPHGLEMFQALTMKERAIGLPFRLVLRHLVRNSAVTISLGGKLTGILQGLAKGSEARVHVLPNAVDVPGQALLKYRSEGPVELLFVGRFAFNKGIDVLMDVARRLVAEGRGELVRFQLAGDGPLLASMRAAGLPPNVELLGRVDDDTLFERYSTCTALVLPTRFEGMPTVVLEAMARSRPIIVSDVGASAELVDARNGWLLPPGDADALHRAVLDLAASAPEQLERKGAASYAKVQARFAWPAVTQGFVDLFRQVAGSR
jgi:glycosyltransferase involved in cell wall biosynthesis